MGIIEFLLSFFNSKKVKNLNIYIEKLEKELNEAKKTIYYYKEEKKDFIKQISSLKEKVSEEKREKNKYKTQYNELLNSYEELKQQSIKKEKDSSIEEDNSSENTINLDYQENKEVSTKKKIRRFR